MKKLTTVLTALTFWPTFSYWKFKGPYVTDLLEPNGYNQKQTLTHAYNHPFLYDKHTQCFLTVGANHPAKNYFRTTPEWLIIGNTRDEQFEFLKGKINPNINFLQKKYKELQYSIKNRLFHNARETGMYLGKMALQKQNKRFLKEEIVQLFDYMNPQMSWQNFIDFYLTTERKNDFKPKNIHEITFQTCIQKHPSIQFINHNNNVFLTNGKQTVNFQEALLEYYTGKKTFGLFAEKLENFYNNISQRNHPIFTTKQKADELFIPLTKLSCATSKEVKLLQNSEIIAVWDFIPDFPIHHKEYPTQHVIFGLAKDTNTQKQFHWITTLKDDLNILFSLATPLEKYCLPGS